MNEWESEQRTDFSTFYSEFKNQVNSFENQSELDFNTWFAGIKEVLDSNTAGKLQNEIDEIIETEFNRYYNLFDSLSVINYNNDTIVTTTDEATMTTKITEDTSSETIITTISPSSGNYNYTRTIVITSTNSEDTVKTTYTRIVKEV
jgi:glucuronate isomerase